MASVQKEGNSWTVRCRINGKQKKFSPRTSGFPNSQKGAKLFLAKLVTDLDSGTFCEPSRMTIAEYAEKWFKTYVVRQTTPKTQQSHRYIIDTHITPGIGTVPLSKLRPVQVEEFYASLKRKDGREGELSDATKGAIHRTLNSILNHAVAMEVIPRNPIKKGMAPKPAARRQGCYDLDQAKTILRLSEGTELHVVLFLALHTGMRLGEICALRWEDVDLDAQAITITHSMEQTRKGIRQKETKTGKGRTIEIGDQLTHVLTRHRAEQARRQLEGSFREYVGHVITYPNGAPHYPNWLSTKWREFIRGTDLPYFCFHTLRHTHVSLLIDMGEQVKVIQDRVGHSSSKITLDTYGHLMKGAGERAVRRLDAAFREPKVATLESRIGG